MTTVIVNKEKDNVKIYSDRLYQCISTITKEHIPEEDIYDIKSIKVNDDLILFSVGNMTVFMTLSQAWRKHPDYLAKIKNRDMLLEEIVEVLYEYAKQGTEQLYSLFIVSKDEVLDLNCGLNINPEKPVSVIPTEYKITGTPQIYGEGKQMFNKPNKLRKMLKKGPEKVFEKINADHKYGTSKEFDELSIKI